MEQATLRACGLVVDYGGKRALDGLSLSVPAGEVYALLGGNGAGKTTTLSAFLGFVPVTAGQLWVAGQALPGSARRRLAYLPENVALYPYLSGLENLRYFSALAGRRLTRCQAHARLTQAGLAEAAHGQRMHAYSKGMRQKVGLAIAYAKQSAAMLLDEPTSGLDPAAIHEFALELRRAAGQGMATLMVTHDLANALQVADRIGIMRGGRLLQEFEARALDVAQLRELYLNYAQVAS